MKPHLLVTAGPTREMLDPVRFLSNVSTGVMGYEIAKAAKRKGFRVTLISGPVSLKAPHGVRLVSVISAQDMEREVKKYFRSAQALIMTAAVCDYTPAKHQKHKIKRIHTHRMVFKQTKDILQAVSKMKRRQYVVGFCLETEDLRKNAIRKLRSKKLDLIVANSYTRSQNPFGRNKTSVLLIDKDLSEKRVSNISKPRFAARLVACVRNQLKKS